jgi:superfamily II DNA or RNA helicase
VSLRPYQSALRTGVLAQWDGGVRNVLAVLPTGGGKTVTFSDIIQAWPGDLSRRYNAPAGTCAVAHRAELVSQMSVTLARYGVRHRVIGPSSLQRTCAALHVDEFRRSFVDPASPHAVAGVDTLVKHDAAPNVGLWVMDEAHHVLRDNKWGTACELFPNARGMGVTATPCRADRKGLGAHADGVFEAMVQGPTMRALINDGYLTDYRVICPAASIDLSQVNVGGSGDYVQVQLREARKKSTLTGDVVAAYLKHARGKLGVTFDVDIESATETASAYRAAGIPAEVVTGKTPDTLRAQILRRFRAREVLQLVNVDLFGEGFDLPAIEVVSMARPTQSYSLYVQQFGRALRLMIDGLRPGEWDALSPEERRARIAASGKPSALIIDHVGNIARHKLPDRWREWTLDAGEKRGRSTPSDAVPTWTCPECGSAWERIYPTCAAPGCSGELVPPGRSLPEQVDGDLIELDLAVLAALRGEVARIDGPARVPQHLDAVAQRAVANKHHARQAAQALLRDRIALWAGYWRAQGHDDHAIYRRFFHAHGCDVMTAQTLGVPDAEALRANIEADLNRKGVTLS